MKTVPRGLLLILAGCATHLNEGEHTFSIRAPEKVVRGEEFHFTITAIDGSGAEVPKAIFYWSVTWEGLEGTRHKGRSGVPQHILVKGSAGLGVLHVLGLDAEGNEHEIARKTFVIE
jgi:hypothetical protein